MVHVELGSRGQTMEEDQWGTHAAIQKMFIGPTPMNVPTHLLLYCIPLSFLIIFCN